MTKRECLRHLMVLGGYNQKSPIGALSANKFVYEVGHIKFFIQLYLYVIIITEESK